MEFLDSVLFGTFLGKEGWLWLLFLGIVITLLVFDLGVLHRKSREIGVRESVILSGAYMAIAFAFGGWIWFEMGQERAMEFFTGYVIEWSLAVDNIFVIALIFGFFAIPREYQYRVLFWGILGVIVFRAILIGVGAALVSEFSWILYVFGAFLLFTGVKMLVRGETQTDLSKNPLLLYLRRHMRVTDTLEGQNFFVRRPDPNRAGKTLLYATPLFLCLMLVEGADLVFAVDSVPAIFAVTTDTYIVYTSNIFAILGLRALYFALAAAIHRFRYLEKALALILIFIGAKIFLVNIVGKIPPEISLSVTVSLLAGGVIVSLLKTRGEAGSVSRAELRRAE